MPSDIYDRIGSAQGCRKLAETFYARLPDEPALVAVYPKHLRCATEALTWFFQELTGGPPEHSAHTPFASLRISHQRFRIGEAEREAWIRNMTLTLVDIVADAETRSELLRCFEAATAYLVNAPAVSSEPSKCRPLDISQNGLWTNPLMVEEMVDAVRAGDATRAIALMASSDLRASFSSNQPLHARLVSLLGTSGDQQFVAHAANELAVTSDLVGVRYSRGRTLLHDAAAGSGLRFAELLLELGARADIADDGGHCPLYFLANSMEGNAELIPLLVSAGADVNANGGIKRCTALHMAARRGHVDVAQALLDAGADIDARDSSGVTPLGRATNCRRRDVAALLKERGART